MNYHLDSRQISELVVGPGNAADEEHVRGCRLCRSQMESARDDLALFRQSVRNWSANEESIPVIQRPSAPNWGWTAAVATCLVAGLLFWHGNHVQPAPTPQTISDADLLGRVDRALSEAVPPSMAPIALNEVNK